MFHDRVMSRVLAHRAGLGVVDDGAVTALADDRRHSDRVPFPGELVLIWNHDPATPHRYEILDAGDGGYRILTSVPLLSGTTGMVIRLLPCSRRETGLGQPVMVAWCRAADADEDGARAVADADAGYEAGLRIF